MQFVCALALKTFSNTKGIISTLTIIIALRLSHGKEIDKILYNII